MPSTLAAMLSLFAALRGARASVRSVSNKIATAVVAFEVQKLKDRETASRTALEAMTCKKSDRWQLKRCFCFMQRRLQAISCSLWRLADVLKPGVDFLGKWMGLFLVRRWRERRKCHAYQAF